MAIDQNQYTRRNFGLGNDLPKLMVRPDPEI